jgi:radical SAM superfamily enzyme YgiQ (UPF0313 family)
MELPSRPKHDRYVRPGEYSQLQKRLQANSLTATIPILISYAFDFRTRLGPFLFIDKYLIPAGPRAVGAAVHAAGFERTRIVLQEWNPSVRPSQTRLDGALPQMLFVSSMQIHSARAYEQIADAYLLGKDRPLIVAGGAKAIYEPWDFFSRGPNGQCSADVVVTGEEFVLLELLDRIMNHACRGEHVRTTFHRLRRSGLLDDIPGLVFREGDERDPSGRLIDTGTQRLVQDLDELPDPLLGLGLLEPPHRRQTLAPRPLPLDQLRRHARIISVVTTHGCKFHCPYCPIPAYNQFTFRHKSPQRLCSEMQAIAEQTGIATLFGTDDNSFNNRQTVEETYEVLARGTVHGKPFRDTIFYGTEATEFDVFKNQDLLPLCRRGGLRAIWFGIEDMTAELVKKGQSPEKTQQLFALLNRQGICPMAMMMHHDGQPLSSPGNLYGLLNQVDYLRRAGSVSLQVTILTPSVGSKGYEEPFTGGMVIDQANGQKVEDYQFDGNHCIATHDPEPWRKQFNLFRAYVKFYNPFNLLRALCGWRRDPVWHMRVLWQVYGIVGAVRSFFKGAGWLWRLYRGPVHKQTGAPRPHLEIVRPATHGGPTFTPRSPTARGPGGEGYVLHTRAE